MTPDVFHAFGGQASSSLHDQYPVDAVEVARQHHADPQVTEWDFLLGGRLMGDGWVNEQLLEGQIGCGG